MMRRRYVLAAALLTAASVVSTPVSAVAGEPTQDGRHCVLVVIGQHDSGELIMADAECFGTFAEAVTAASGGTVKAPVSATPESFLAGGGGVLMSTFTLGIHYDGYSGSGTSYTVVGSSCTGGYWNTPSSFDNKTSSSYGGCYKLRHYDNANRGGASLSTYGSGSTHNLYSFNNRTESVQYLP